MSLGDHQMAINYMLSKLAHGMPLILIILEFKKVGLLVNKIFILALYIFCICPLLYFQFLFLETQHLFSEALRVGWTSLLCSAPPYKSEPTACAAAFDPGLTAMRTATLLLLPLLLLASFCGGDPHQPPAAVRHYYIAAVEIGWDYIHVEDGDPASEQR